MAVTTKVLESYRAGIDPDSVLGYITGYTIQSDTRIPHDEFVKHLKDHDLDPHINRPKDEDAFKRVTTDAKRRRLPVEGSDDLFDEYLIRDLGTTGSTIERRIVRERLQIKTTTSRAKKTTTTTKRLDYEEQHTIVFNRNTGKITIQNPKGDVDPEAKDICREVRENYVAWRGCVHDWAVRNYIRKSISKLQALPVLASGGTYFVSSDHLEMLARLEQFVDSLPGDSTVEVIPLVDSKKQRAMVRRAFEEETVTAANALIDRINELRDSGRPVRRDLLKTLQNEYDAIGEKVAAYEKLLKVTTAVGRSQQKVMAAKLQTLKKKAA